MKKYIGSFILVLAVCMQFTSCTREDNSNKPQSSSLSFEWTHLVKKEGDRSSEQSPCLTIDLRYPIASGGGDSIREALNTYVERYVRYTLMSFASDTRDSLAPVDTLIQQLTNGYREFVRENPDAPSQWSIELKSSVMRNDSTIVSLSTETYTYLGGAHPLGVTGYASFATATGKKLTIDEVTSNKQRLTTLAEQVFRREREIDAATNLDSAGFWFGEQGFSLPDNFALGDSSLILYYNPYDIAPYVFGPTFLELPYSQLQGIIDERFLRK
jgi:hypothetical protein